MYCANDIYSRVCNDYGTVQCPFLAGCASAVAFMKGSVLAPQISGTVFFRNAQGGTEVCVDIHGLPPYQPASPGKDPIGPFGFHIHEVGNCGEGNPEDPFQMAGSHWNPDKQPHGNHAGDLPVLFSNNGRARMCFFTSRFKPADVIGKAIIVHQNPDDYRTEPAGRSGKRLACGIIKTVGTH